MDFKSLVNKENFKSILHHHLKSQVHAKFANIISKDIQSQSENEAILSDNIVSSVSNKISQSDDCKEFMNTFLNGINHLFQDRKKYVPKEDNQGTVSQCSSASSVSTSIDYVSFDQFQNIIHTLTNGVNVEKLEALETFSRLPSLEHIIKQTLWPSVEIGLHGALISNVSLLKEASLKVYTKMLSSSEPKVVQEGFNSLIKHVIQNMLPSMNQNSIDFINKCKSVVEILVILNKFLQNIPSHWLRYPQPVIEDITIQSVSILSYGSKNSKIFPIWLCFALCDKKSKWLKNMLYGHVSRAFLLDALRKDPDTLKLSIQFCDNFILSDHHMTWEKCCQNFAEVSEITHIVCFLSHLLNYSQGREIFTCIYEDEPFPWVNVLDLAMKCTHKLCSISCFSCCVMACDVLSAIWCQIWSSNDIALYCDSLIKMLVNFNYIENMSTNSVCFIIQCLGHIPCDFTTMNGSQETEDMVYDFICMVLKYLTNFPFDLSDISVETSTLLNSSLLFMKKILSEPSNLFINSIFISIFSPMCSKMGSLSKLLISSYAPGTKNSSVLEIEQNISQLFITMLQKPNSVSILHSIELFETSVNILLEKILEDIRVKSSVCPRDVSVLSMALNFSTKSLLNKSIIFKLSSVIWQFDTSNLQNLPKVKSILETLIPSIFPHIFKSEILLDASIDSDIKLFQYIILFPSLTNQEFVMFEEYSLLALQIISLLSCSILSTCYLEAKHNMSDMLLKLQTDHTNESGIVIIDPLSVIQNHILVKLFTIGGLNERVLPPEALLSNIEKYDCPFVECYPVPEVYYHKINVASEIANASVELNDENLKDVFLEHLTIDLLSVNMVSQMLEMSLNFTEISPALSRTLNFVTLDCVDHLILQDEILIGLRLTQRYGEILNLFKNEAAEDLEKLLKAGKCLLSAESKSQLDLFICTVCLIFKCDIQKSWLFLEAFSQSPASLFVWHERILQASDQNGKYVTIFNVIMEYCDIIVKQKLPLVYSAFQFGKVLPSVLFQYWTTLCYWNYLEFTEVSHFVLSSVMMGGDMSIYFFVSVLKHMQGMVLKNAHSFNLINLLKMNVINGYKMCNYMGFMLELSEVYKSKISKSVADILCE